jgi:hypothetical protein
MAIPFRLMVFFLAAPVLIAAEFHVSTTGKDTNAGTASQPFATIQRAQKAVRDFRAAQQGGQQEIDVVLHGGTYWQTNTLTFTNTDSGSAGAPVVYTNAPGELVAVSGGRVITGTWTQSPGKPYWQISIPDVQSGKWAFNSLTVNGLSATCARYPNEGEKELRGFGPEPGGDPYRSLVYYPGDFDPSWTNQQDISIVWMGNWTGEMHGVTSVDPAKQVLRFENSGGHKVNYYERLPRYYLRNVFEKLDAPGEWYLNKTNGILYYYPRPGENLSSAEVIAPVVKTPLVTLSGNLASNIPVQYIQFKGIHFRHADTDIKANNGKYRQGFMFLDGSVKATAFRQGLFQGCTFEQLGDYALNIADGCRDVTVQGCHFCDLGAGAVLIGVTDLSTVLRSAGSGTLLPNQAEPLRLVTNIVVDNNIVHRTGTIWNGPYGIVNRFASFTRITHNELFDTDWSPIGLDARWDRSTGVVYSQGNEVAYNSIHDFGLYTQTDGGGIYQQGPLDTYIHHNIIHDSFAYPLTAGLQGIYFDANSYGASAEKNIVYKLDGNGFFQNVADNNSFDNNIGAFARDGFAHLGGLDSNNLNFAQITRNIYVTTNNVAQKDVYPGGSKPALVASNFYQTLQTNVTLLYGGLTLTNWQKLGWDSNSVEGNAGLADPLNGNFSVPPTSPAVTAIGFVPFGQEMSSVGVYGDPVWMALPASQPMRQHSQYQSRQDLAVYNDFSIDPNLYSNGITMPVFNVDQTNGMIVTTEVPGINGPKCIKAAEQTNNILSYDPYAKLSLYGLNQGRVQVQLAFMQPTNAPAACTIECRSSGNPYSAGPSLTISRNGTLKAGSWSNQLTPGQWYTFTVSFGLGAQGDGNYSLTISNAGGVTNRTLPFSSTNFSDMANFVIYSGDTNSIGSYYLDAISLKTAAINFPALGPVTYGNGLTLGLGASATTLLPIGYSSPDTNLVSISGTNVTVLGAGTATIVATQMNDGNHLATVPVTNTLVIAPAPVSRRQTNALNAGCTWVSFNVATPDGTWGGLLAGDKASDNDVILGSAGSLTYHSGTWYPSDPGYRPAVGSMCMVMSATARNMIAAGTVPALPVALSLAAGWNWMSPPGDSNTVLSTMIPGLQPADGDVIVDQLGGMATYYRGTWYSNTKGSLPIRPGLGYQIYLHNAQNVQLY